MKIVIALDSFKGSCSVKAACQSVANGFQRVSKNLDLSLLPVSDGGEGLLEALEHSSVLKDVQQHQFICTGPYGQTIESKLLTLAGNIGVIELAECCGLELTPKTERNPEHASSYGLGQAVKKAMDLGCTKIIIGLGGSATNDGGAGFAQALGAEFYSVGKQRISRPITGGDLISLESIEINELDERIKHIDFYASCDVTNPLLGPTGATYVYGGQKGATGVALDRLEAGMRHYAHLMHQVYGKDCANEPGAGAAGGMGAALKWFLSAKLDSGIALVLSLIGAESYIRQADLVIVGEGRLDSQSANGKAPVGVARMARKHGVPVVAICGGYSEDSTALYDEGISAMWSICPGPVTLEEAMKNGEKNIANTAENLLRTILPFSKSEKSNL